MDTRPHALFRSEAVAARRPRALGEIVVARPVSTTCLTGTAAAIACIVVAFFYWGRYTQHTTVTGRLVPDRGIVKVYAPQDGTVVERLVAEGQPVERGALLFVVSSERLSVGLTATREAVGRALEHRRRSLEAEQAQTRALERTERKSLERTAAALDREAASLRATIASQRERLTLAENARSRYARLRARGFVTEDALAARREDLLEQRSRLQSLERERAGLERQLADVETKLEQLPLRYGNELAELDRAITAARRELTENEARRRLAVTAPVAGTVTAVVTAIGRAAEARRPLASIVPVGSRLHAELYAPSRAVGFVAPGDTARLRYTAYPYQKFGHHRATIESISRIAAPVAELVSAAPVAGGAATEPVYRIRLELPSQSIVAYGRPYALKPGMAVEADLLEETRRLYEWVLEPLYTLARGRR